MFYTPALSQKNTFAFKTYKKKSKGKGKPGQVFGGEIAINIE